MKDSYDREVSMLCSTCGGSDFEFEGEAGPVTCAGCGRIFTRDELKAENAALIAAELEAMKADVMAGIRKDLKKRFGKFK